MKLFDLHCDTLYELLSTRSSLQNRSCAVTLSGMKNYDKCVRCFAVWSDDETSPQKANEQFYKMYSIFKEQLCTFKEDITEITDTKSLENAKIGMMLTVENCSALNNDIANVKKFVDLGVKVFSLTWNGENSLGYGQLENRGLKPFGKECVKAFEQTSAILDVSHLSEKGFYDICELSNKPFVATHSNAKSIALHNRNLSDDQIREIINRKGLIGLNLYSVFLNQNPEKASKYDILRHAEHILSLGGENVLSIGTDFDGAEVIREYKNDKKLSGLERLFLKNGFSRELTDKILYKNAENFLYRQFLIDLPCNVKGTCNHINYDSHD